MNEIMKPSEFIVNKIEQMLDMDINMTDRAQELDELGHTLVNAGQTASGNIIVSVLSVSGNHSVSSLYEVTLTKIA